MARLHYFIRSKSADRQEASYKVDSIQFEDYGEDVFVSIRFKGKDMGILIPKSELDEAVKWMHEHDTQR